MTSERLPANGSAPSKVEDPPTYEASKYGQGFVSIPSLQFPNLETKTDKPVTKGECILHLKLLAAFADLRATVSTVDGLFGIHDSQADKFGGGDEMAKCRALIRIREKRWEVYTSRAVDRYVDWWTKIVPAEELPTISRMLQIQYSIKSNPLNWLASNLPPLDVLMVWHAHMLNPRAYLEDCIRASKMTLWNTEFPWQLIDNVIDTKTFNYNPSDEAIETFTGITGRLWDNLDESEEKTLECLMCSRQFNVPWTTGEIGPSPDYAFEKCTGYADSGFEADCECTFKHSHQVMRVARFNKDVEKLLAFDHPMPGTYLDLEGIPGQTQELSFPNALIKAGQRTVYGCVEPGGTVNNMYGVRRLLEAQMGNFYLMKSINGNGPRVRLTKNQKISIRRMMSHYWENSSIFGLDLVGAVIRQGTFIQKMDNLDWLHSPALSTTMYRLIRKYMNFLVIMLRYSNKMAVPTLDVDLAWHTHQMSASRYYTYTTSRSVRYGPRRFPDHDDKVDEGKLSDAFEWTSKEYKTITDGEIYSECTCWYCEATREPILYSGNMILSSTTRNSRRIAEYLHDDPRISSEPDKNPHISAHNAVRSGIGPSPEDVRTRRLQGLWEKASRRAEKRREKEGKGDDGNSPAIMDAYYPMIWGYPYYIPLYAPYMVDPGISTGPYPSNPGWMSGNVAGYGNCAMGTCTNVVAAGQCAAQNGGAACGSVFNSLGNLVSDVGGCGAGGCGGGSGCGSGCGGGCGGG